MRSLITLGVVSLVGVASMAACGDDSGDDGPANTAGTGGSRGGTGGAGGATGGTGGATGGTAGGGRGGTGGTGGAPPGPLATCTGCVELIAPLTGPNDLTDNPAVPDQIGYQFVYATPVDFSDAVVTWTIAAVAPNANTFAQLYAQNGAPNYDGAYLSFPLDPVQFPANQFREISIDLAAIAAAPGDAGVPDAGEPPVVVDPDAGADAGDDAGVPPLVPTIFGAFDKSLISQLGITIGVGQTFTGSTVLRVAVDEVAITNVPSQATPRTFTTGVDTLALNNYLAFPGMQAPVHHP